MSMMLADKIRKVAWSIQSVRQFSAIPDTVATLTSPNVAEPTKKIRKRRSFRERPPAISLTENAAKRISELLEGKPQAHGIRLGIKTRGCNGLSYTMNYAEEINKADEEVVAHGVRVFVEPKALFHVVGTEMDFEDSPIASEFVFNNPNAKGSCGCGESFNV